MIIFRVKTDQAVMIKILGELFYANLKTAGFMIDKNSLQLLQADDKMSTLIDFTLQFDNCLEYEFNMPQKLFVGLNMAHFHSAVKMIKKKDLIELVIDDTSPNILGMSIFTDDCVTKTNVQIQQIQIIQIDIPTGYDNSITIKSTEFQKMIKNTIGNVLTVSSNSNKIRFTCCLEGIINREVYFENSMDAVSSKTKTVNKAIDEFTYKNDFDIKQISKFAKMTRLHNSLSIFTQIDLPLLIRMDVGTIGTLSIYIKSKQDS